MRGRDFLQPVRVNVRGGSEPFWRDAVVGAYYALFLECREALARWRHSLPPKQNVHATVRMAFVFAKDPTLKAIGYALERLSNARNDAHYDIRPSPSFTTMKHAQNMVQRCDDALALLDALEADPARLQQAIASL